MKIYISNITKNNNLSGGWTFLRNFKKGFGAKVEFVDKWQDCDIIFVFGITTIDKGEIHEAVKAGKKLVLRIDNIPRRNRNTRMQPIERLKEFGNIASLVVYQSKWCKEYAGYFIDNTKDVIINNGVDKTIFNTDNRKTDSKTYLYINYNDNPNKRFDEAIYRFDMLWREDKESHLVIAGNTPKVYSEHPEYNFDSVSNSEIEYLGVMNSEYEVADLMKTCDYILYPSFAEAYSNTLLEAIACGLTPRYPNPTGGSDELIEKNYNYFNRDIKVNVKSIQEMCDEYYNEFNKLIK